MAIRPEGRDRRKPIPRATYLDRRWAEGCRNAARLWRGLVAVGFLGRPAIVRAWATRQRKGEPGVGAGGAGARAAAKQPPSAARIARLLMADTDALPETERGFVARLLAQAPGLADVAKRPNLPLRRGSEEGLDKMLDDAAGTQLAEFATGLRRDLAAVQAALDTPWTTSPAEGQIDRTKTIERSM